MSRIPFVFCVALLLALQCSAAPDVNLTSGLWKGSIIEVPDVEQKVEVFYAVRYAEPPLNELRFKHPVAKTYSGEQDATERGPACIQGNAFYIRENVSFSFSNTSEDCLHLNIYKPAGVQNAPIAVYFYGGSFLAGYNNLFLYDPEELVAREQIIVVTVNYRLSVFGFLYLNNTEAPGNQGLHDMLLASQFIKQNAVALGGDPDKITLWGQSAGAFAVGFLMGSPLAKGLFTRAFLQSGGAASGATALRLNSINGAISAASVLDCVDNVKSIDQQLEDIARCMKRVDAEKLFKAVNEELGERYTITFQPMYGIDELLPVFPFPETNVPVNDDIKEVFISSVSNEGSMFILGILERFQYDEDSMAEDYLSLAQIVLKVILEIPVEYTKRNIVKYISPISEDSLEHRHSISRLFGDLLFECPADLYSAVLAHKGVKVYRYLWDHRPTTSYWPEWTGATHCDDIPFTMGSQYDIGNKAEKSHQTSAGLLEYLKKTITEQEKQLTKNSLKMVADFIKNGIPSRPDGAEWPLYEERGKKTVRIDVDSFSDYTGPLSDKCYLWKEFLTNNNPVRNPTYSFAESPETTTETNEITTKQPKKPRKKPRVNSYAISISPSSVIIWMMAIVFGCHRSTFQS